MNRKCIAYIVVAGVNQYENAEFNLKYAVDDAKTGGRTKDSSTSCPAILAMADSARAWASDAAGLKTILNHSISNRAPSGLLQDIDAGLMALIIDACNSGQALESDEGRHWPFNSKGLAQLAWDTGMYVLTADQSHQAALEVRDLQHGYLTYALVEEGLRCLSRSGYGSGLPSPYGGGCRVNLVDIRAFRLPSRFRSKN